MVFSFIGVSLLTMAVAIPMAEMCSMYPVAGGQYSWVAALAPPRFARGLSYVTGWFMIIGRNSHSLVFIQRLITNQVYWQWARPITLSHQTLS